jgi:LCP family protein required for cell wall assembly
VNILVLGSDWRANSGFRTDVVLLVSIFTRENKVNLISFPRDLWVEIPNLQEERINTAMGYGGFPLLASTFERNFAIHIDHYMMTDFSGFQGIVDALGGIEIDAQINMSDRCDLPNAYDGWCSVGPGTVQLDGPTALWYVRSRKFSSDFDRTRRAQEVLIGLFHRLMSLDAFAQAPEIYNLLINSVETDMDLNDFLEIVNVAPAVISDSSRINRYAITLDEVLPYTTDAGAYILIPNYDAIWQVIQKAVYTP